MVTALVPIGVGVVAELREGARPMAVTSSPPILDGAPFIAIDKTDETVAGVVVVTLMVRGAVLDDGLGGTIDYRCEDRKKKSWRLKRRHWCHFDPS
jgi:hypothetical protein